MDNEWGRMSSELRQRDRSICVADFFLFGEAAGFQTSASLQVKVGDTTLARTKTCMTPTSRECSKFNHIVWHLLVFRITLALRLPYRHSPTHSTNDVDKSIDKLKEHPVGYSNIACRVALGSNPLRRRKWTASPSSIDPRPSRHSSVHPWRFLPSRFSPRKTAPSCFMSRAKLACTRCMG